MWSHLSQGGGSGGPPPPPPGGGFPPPGGAPPPQQQQGGFFPPPPQAATPGFGQQQEEYYESDGSDEGGLGMTVNMVTSAASMLFSAARPLANKGPASFAPPPPQAAAPPTTAQQFAPPPVPAAPIEQFASMLDDVESEEEDMQDIDMNEDPTATPAAPPAGIPAATTATQTASSLFERPPTPTNASFPPPTPPVESNNITAAGVFGQPPTPTTITPENSNGSSNSQNFPPPTSTPNNPFAQQPPTPTPPYQQQQRAPPTPNPPPMAADQSNPFARPPPTPTYPTTAAATAPPMFGKPPPTPNPPPQEALSTAPPPTPDVATTTPAAATTPSPAMFGKPPPHNVDGAPPPMFGVPPPTPNPPPQEALFQAPPPTPDVANASAPFMPPPTPDAKQGVSAPPPTPVDEKIPLGRQPNAPTVARALETIDSIGSSNHPIVIGDAGSKSTTPSLPKVTPPTSPGKKSSGHDSTPLINNKTGTAVAAAAAEELAKPKSKILLPPVAATSPSVTRTLKGPPPRSEPKRPTRSRFKLPTPRKSRSRTPTRNRASAARSTPTGSSKLPLPTPRKRTPRAAASPRLPPSTPIDRGNKDSVQATPVLETPKTTSIPPKNHTQLESSSVPNPVTTEPAQPPEETSNNASNVFDAPPTQQADSVFGAPETPQADSVFSAPPTQQADSVFDAPPTQQVDNVFGAPPRQEELSNKPPEQQVDNVFSAPPTQQADNVFGAPPTKQELSNGPPSQQADNVFSAPPTQQADNVFGAPPTQQAISNGPPTQQADNVFGASPTQQADNVFGAPPKQPELPEGWEETIDPSTQDVYYFNATTGETSWDRPTIQTSSLSEDIAPSNVTETATSESLPEGWEETIDPNTQQIYYFNSITGETAWDRPTTGEVSNASTEVVENISSEPIALSASENTKETANSPGAEAASTQASMPEAEENSSQDILPEHWVEATDPATQLVYYYNSVTEATAWERPTTSAEPSTVIVEPKSLPEDEIDEPSTKISPTTAEEDSSPLPEGWMETTSPDDGQVYYYNTITGDTSWDRPSPPAETPKSAPEPDILADKLGNDASPPEEQTPKDSTTEVFSSTEDEDSPLPQGWEEGLDPSTNQLYYFNSHSGETSWDRPTKAKEEPETVTEQTEMPVESSPEEEPLHQSQVPIEEEVQTELSPSAEDKDSALPAGWEEVLDTNTTQYYYYNSITGETSWERPVKQETPVMKEADAVGGESGLAHIAPEVEPSPELAAVQPTQEVPTPAEETNLALPEGWEELIDPTTSNVYFYNSTTGETSWDRPSKPPSTSEVPEAAVEPQNEGPPVVNSSSSPPIASQPESEHQVANLSPAEEELSALPEGWEEVSDPSTLQIYFYNSITGETSWDRPTKEGFSALQEEISKQPTEPENTVDVATDPVIEEADEVIATSPPKADATSYDKNELPEGWVEEFDASSNQNYYYNTVSGETRWERPSSEPVIAPPTTENKAEHATIEVENTDASTDPEYTDSSAIVSSASKVVSEEEDTGIAVINSEKESLPDGWVEAHDPSTGQAYYYSETTGEITWERPSTIVPSVQMPEVIEGNSDQQAATIPPLESATELAPETEKVEPEPIPETKTELSSLPSGWEQIDDPASGTYYYNSITGETSWDRPIDRAEGGEAEIEDSAGMNQEGPPDVQPEVISSNTLASTSKDQNQAGSTDALPENWSEVVDPTTGETYYYNSVSGETSWERPSMPVQAKGMELEDNRAMNSEPESTRNFENENPEKQIEPAKQANLETEQKETADVLPEGWIEAHDSVSGDLYYYHSESGTVTWDKPPADAGKKDDDPGDGDDELELEPDDMAEEPKEPLPEGWIESIDPETKNLYYYNTITGDVSWDRPCVSQTEENDNTGAEGDQTDKEVVTVEPEPEEVSANDFDDGKKALPEGWIEDIDPKTEQVYYYNSLTGDVTWERPGDTTKEDSPEEAEQNIDEPPTTNDVLPDGWEEVADESTGEIYFYNSTTGETSWERPKNEISSAEEVNMNVDTALEPAKEEVSGLPEGWEEVTDPTTQDVYYFNSISGETSWDRPVVHSNVVSDDAPANNEMDTMATSAEVPSIDETLDALAAEFKDDMPSDTAPTASDEVNNMQNSEDNQTSPSESWTEVRDTTTGEVSYYQNTVTNAITFTKPAALQNDDAAPNEDTTRETEEPLPDGWTEMEDPSSGQVYYYNSLTDEATWDRPTANIIETEVEKTNPETDNATDNPDANEASVPSEPNEVESAQAESGNLPDDWVESTDPTSGQKYYYNIVTEEVSWDRPIAELAKAETFRTSNTSDMHPDEPRASNDAEQNDDNPEATSSSNDNADNNGGNLRAGWEAVEDPSSGQIYYYHAKSGESSWEKPVEEALKFEGTTQGDTDVQPDSMKETEKIVDNGVEKKDTNENASNSLPNGWEAVEDPSTGEVYYFNAESGESSWERPEVAETEVAPKEDKDLGPNTLEETEGHKMKDDIISGIGNEDVDIDHPSTENLPDGWEEIEDASSGQLYYYHAESGETSWERPVVGEVKRSSEENMEAIHNNVDESENATESIEPIEAVNVAIDLAEGWEEVEDETGQIYYYNAVSGETSWDRPTAGGTEEPKSPLDEDTNALSNKEEEEVPSDLIHDDKNDPTHVAIDSLPVGWEEAEDAEGQIYYYNAESGETSWERPKGQATEIHNSSAAPDDDFKADGDDTKQEAINDLPDGWEEAEDADGQIYYYHAESGETSWEKPKAEGVIKEPELDNGEEAFDIPSKDVDDVLPDGWVQSEDPTTGNIYYYNTESEEVSWERPTPGVTNALGREPSEEISFEPKSDDDNELPEGWIESEDPTSGEVYYYHAESGETSWERPSKSTTAIQEEDAVEETHPEPNMSENAKELPAGWIESRHPDSGEIYYYHTESGETTWERPVVIEENKGSLDLSTVEEEDVDAMDSLNYTVTSEPNANPPMDGALPKYWVETEDANGEIYYFNSLTQETSWERPTADNSPKEPELKLEILESKEDDVLVDNVLPLPKDWIESKDPDSGDTYYYNTKTEETSWERPIDPSASPVEDNIEPGKVLTASEEETSGKLVDKDAGTDAKPTETAISSDWVEVEDESGGDRYYYNPTTGETSWDKPEEMQTDLVDINDADQAQPLDDPKAKANDLLEGWVEVVDSTSGDLYWYNHETQETTWEKPSKAADERIDSDANDDQNIRDDWVDVKGPMPEDDAPVLPQGWVESTDPSSGETFYWNENTNETSWEFPIAKDQSYSGSNVAPTISTTSSMRSHSAKIQQVGSVSDIEVDREKFGVLGPFTLCDDSVVTKYIMSKAESEDILWKLIAIAVKSKGRLRSDYGVVDKSGPEAAIVKLLLSSPDYAKHKKQSKNDIVIIEEKTDNDPRGQDSIVKVQDYLIRGDREHAIEEAIMIGDYATALLVASMCDPATYKRVAQKFAQSKFRSDSPMYTTTMLFSGKIEAPASRKSGNWGVKAEELRDNWKSHLASIINNRTFGWDKIVLSLGDRLNEIGYIKEAHFCYMVCGYPITSPTDEETRASLLGCDHSNSKNQTLLTEESLVAYELTEAYEWAKRLGNQHAYFATFQPYKLMYAMLLADTGNFTQAQKFIQSIQISPDNARTALSDITRVSVDQMFDDDIAFELAYNEVEYQLMEGKVVKSNFSKSVLNGGYLEITAPKSQASSNFNPSHAQVRDESVRFDFSQTKKDPALDATFMTAKSNLMELSGYSLTPKSDSKNESKSQFPPTPEGSKGLKEPTRETRNIDEPTQSKPAKSGPNPSATPYKQPKPADTELKPKEQSKPAAKQPKPAPVSAPAVMAGKKEEKANPSTPAPASSGKPKQAPSSGAFSGMKSWFIKKLNPDAKECFLPENEEQPYYDEKLKRWIFPGDDPAEVGKPLAPPPTIAKKEEDTPKPEEPKDAVSAMMAPPPSRGISAKKRTVGGPPGGMASPMMGMMMPPGVSSQGMATPMGGAAAPKFATFTPKAAVFTPKPAAEAPAPAEGQEEPTNDE